MSWFGETFGDSLNSLKGQITKITKEVLADDETNASDGTSLAKELELKNLEIAALKKEFDNLHVEYSKHIEFYKNRNESGDKSLEKELIEVKQERDHLNSCLDQLQSEHQANLSQVISIRDKYKQELTEVKTECSVLKSKLDELLKSRVDEKSSDGECREIENLKSEIKKLQLEVESNSELKEQLEKLKNEIDVLKNEKQKTENDNKKYQGENEELKKWLQAKEAEISEKDSKISMLINEKEEILKQNQNNQMGIESKYLELQQKLKDLLEALKINVKDVEISDGENCLALIEKEWRVLKKFGDDLESEVKQTKDENFKLHNELKAISEKEKNNQDEVNNLKKVIADIKAQKQDCISGSQTDDVKRLEQEVAQLMNLLVTKNNEITDYSRIITTLEQETRNLKSCVNTEQETRCKVEESLKCKESELNESLKLIENLKKFNIELESTKKTMGQQIEELLAGKSQVQNLQSELDSLKLSKTELENCKSQLEKSNVSLKNDFEYLKAELIVKESNIAELMKSNVGFQEEVNTLQTQINELQKMEPALKKWKEASVDLEIQRQDLASRTEELEAECLKLRGELELSAVKDAEIAQLKLANSNLVESCNKLHYELETKLELEHSQVSKGNELEERCQKQQETIAELREENNELKTRIQKFQEQMKLQMLQKNVENDVQQHRRSKSDVEPVAFETSKGETSATNEVALLKQAIQQEQSKNRTLQNQLQETAEKEASARKEFERLKQHLLEVEDHYTEEAVSNEKIINELKTKLIATEEQLQNSSTLYTSMKVRDNQHLESLQNQIRLITTQRDDFQAKLSSAEDEVQKHKASLMSLQIVLEQFQQDKEREVEAVAMKYEKQLQATHGRFGELEAEIEGLKRQLTEAKNGLKAASRLGEQLEKKTQQVAELESSVANWKEKIAELEASLSVANQSNSGKVDKSLIKNLVVGYISSANADRKSQVLKIMASVLDLDQDERNKLGVDSTSSGWLHNILHPKGGAPSNQSLSEAFIRFLENESRPQPQVKFHPEQFQPKSTNSSRPASASPKPTGRISELTLPTFSSLQENESSIILKSVLKDS